MTKKINAVKVFVLVMLLVVAVASNTVQAWWWNKQTEFAVLDREAIQQNLLEYKELAATMKKLDDEYSVYSQDVLTEQNKLSKEMLSQYEKDQAGKGEEKRAGLLKEYRKKAEQLAEQTQQKLDQKKRETELKKEQAKSQTEEKVNLLIETVAKKEKIQHVLDQRYTYTEVKKDLTPLVIKESRKGK